MDQMKIRTNLLRGIVSRLLSHKITEKMGYNINLDLKEMEVTHENDLVYGSVKIDFYADDQIMNLID